MLPVAPTPPKLPGAEPLPVEPAAAEAAADDEAVAAAAVDVVAGVDALLRNFRMIFMMMVACVSRFHASVVGYVSFLSPLSLATHNHPISLVNSGGRPSIDCERGHAPVMNYQLRRLIAANRIWLVFFCLSFLHRTEKRGWGWRRIYVKY